MGIEPAGDVYVDLRFRARNRDHASTRRPIPKTAWKCQSPKGADLLGRVTRTASGISRSSGGKCIVQAHPSHKQIHLGSGWTRRVLSAHTHGDEILGHRWIAKQLREVAARQKQGQDVTAVGNPPGASDRVADWPSLAPSAPICSALTHGSALLSPSSAADPVDDELRAVPAHRR